MSRLEIVHHEGYDPGINSLFVPGIKVASGNLVFISGVTGAGLPRPPAPSRRLRRDPARRRITSAPRVRALVELTAAGCTPADVVSLTRFLTNVAEDQETINTIQAAFFAGHLPTSTTVEVKRLATDPRLRLEIQAIAVAPA